MSPGGGERPVEARVGGIRYLLLSQHEPDADRSLGLGPVGDDVIHRRIGGIDRLHDAKPLGIIGIDLQRVARVIAVEVVCGDDDRGTDADRIHRRYHLVPGRRCWAVQLPGPGPAGMVALVSVHLDVYDRHRPILPLSSASMPFGDGQSRQASTASLR